MKSHGKRRKTRKKFKKRTREKGLSPISRAIQAFEPEQSVHIDIDPSVHRGMPDAKFNGMTGKVIGKSGRAYIVMVRDGGKMKQVFARAEHLKPQLDRSIR
jgi:large subunit ribosomal protein L21e